jgi:acyl-coenzyme A thioesterase PaaI-like protein
MSAAVAMPVGRSFDSAISLSPGEGAGVFVGDLDRDWWGGIGPHGGYLAAILMHGLQLAAEGGRRTPRSLTIHFLNTATPGRFELRSTKERSGGTLETVGFRMLQGEKPIVVGLGAVAAARSSAAVREARMPDADPWREVGVSHFLTDSGVTDLAPPFAVQLEYRHCLGPDPLSGGQEAVTGGWIRFRDGRPLDLPAAAMLMDAWWPAVWSRLRAVPRTPTIDLTLHFREPLAPTPEPVLAVFRTRLAQDGLMDEEGELWSIDGRLLVQSRQLSMLLAPPENEASRPESDGGDR